MSLTNIGQSFAKSVGSIGIGYGCGGTPAIDIDQYLKACMRLLKKLEKPKANTPLLINLKQWTADVYNTSGEERTQAMLKITKMLWDDPDYRIVVENFIVKVGWGDPDTWTKQ